MSFFSPIIVTTKAVCASRRETRFAGLRGSVSPLAARSIQRIAVEAATPNRSAHFRAESPASDAFKTRFRKSLLNARPIQITLHDGNGESETSRIVTWNAIHGVVDVL
jgi:hypothetical protein